MAIRLLDFLFSRQTNRGENWCPLIGHAKKSLGIRRWNKLWGCWGNVVATQGCRETGCSSKEGANYVGYVVSHPRERERELADFARRAIIVRLNWIFLCAAVSLPIQTSMKRRHDRFASFQERITFEVFFFSSKVISLSKYK